MAEVIDELIVVLGLDSRKFTEGQREALASFKKTQEGAQQFGKGIEDAGVKISDLFSTVKKGILGVVGGIVGNEAVQFVNRISEMDAATGRWARTINTSVPNLSIWKSMVGQMGGNAGNAAAQLDSLQQTLNKIKSHDIMPSGGLSFLASKSGVNLWQDSSDTLLRKFQAYLEGEMSAGRMTPDVAKTRLTEAGVTDQDIINVLTGDFKKLEAAAKAGGNATAMSAAEAEKLVAVQNKMTQSWDNLGRALMLLSGSSITDFLERTTKILLEFSRGEFISSDSTVGRLLGLDKSRAKAKLAEGMSTSGGGNTRGDRNNNPGNMEFGTFARNHGATGSDGRFAVFPDWATGAAAQEALVRSNSYHGLSLHEFAAKYAEGSPAWEKTVGGALGVGPNDVINNQDPRLINAIRAAEGTGGRAAAAGRGSGRGASSSVTQTNTIHVTAPEPHAAANMTVEQLKRWGQNIDADRGLR